jgi:hypothetical protein
MRFVAWTIKHNGEPDAEPTTRAMQCAVCGETFLVSRRSSPRNCGPSGTPGVPATTPTGRSLPGRGGPTRHESRTVTAGRVSKTPLHQHRGGINELFELRRVDAAGPKWRLGVRDLWWNGDRPRIDRSVTLDA